MNICQRVDKAVYNPVNAFTTFSSLITQTISIKREYKRGRGRFFILINLWAMHCQIIIFCCKCFLTVTILVVFRES